MSLLEWPRWLWVVVVGLLAIWLLHRVRGILLPFVLGTVIAYLLNPLLDLLQRRGWRRVRAIGVVFGAFLVVFVVVALRVLPTALEQAGSLAANYQTYAQKGHQFYQGLQHNAKIWGRLVGVLPRDVAAGFAQAGREAQAYALTLLNSSPGWLNRSLTLLSLLIITPVVTFWLLLDYHALGRRLLLVVPERRRDSVREMLADINQKAGGYLLGTAVLGAVVALYATVVLTIAGVPFAILLGILTGLFYGVPYIGYPSAVAISGLVMVVSGKSLGSILVVLADHGRGQSHCRPGSLPQAGGPPGGAASPDGHLRPARRRIPVRVRRRNPRRPGRRRDQGSHVALLAATGAAGGGRRSRAAPCRPPHPSAPSRSDRYAGADRELYRASELNK